MRSSSLSLSHVIRSLRMTSIDFNESPQWQWPTSTGISLKSPNDREDTPMPGAFVEKCSPRQRRRASLIEPSPVEKTCHPSSQDPHVPPKSNTYPRSRTCRICLETVQPTLHPLSNNISGLFQTTPSPTYDSADPEAGRLLRPCKCKGSSKYVHEGCLQAWRHADPGYGRRNYWQCPTCGFWYRLERMKWGRWVSSTATQFFLTMFIFLMTLFVMGFIADPIINLYMDPFSILSSAPLSKVGAKIEPIFTDDGTPTWTEHFIKGLASLGLLGFIKVIFALSPWQWWNLRSTGIIRGGGNSGNTGRDRLANISWMVVLIGIGTFLWVCMGASDISLMKY